MSLLWKNAAGANSGIRLASGMCSPLFLLIPLAYSFLGLLRTFSGLVIVMTVCSGILGMVMYRPAGVIYFTVMTACFAEIYQREISLLWLVMAVGISTMLIIAPPLIFVSSRKVGFLLSSLE